MDVETPEESEVNSAVRLSSSPSITATVRTCSVAEDKPKPEPSKPVQPNSNSDKRGKPFSQARPKSLDMPDFDEYGGVQRALLLPADTDLSRSNQEELKPQRPFLFERAYSPIRRPMNTFSDLYPHSDLKSDPTGAAKVLFEASYVLPQIFTCDAGAVKDITTRALSGTCAFVLQDPPLAIERAARRSEALRIIARRRTSGRATSSGWAGASYCANRAPRKKEN
ncbi:hypothetical protein DFH09DRAFT_1099251 [Mycena vulgaris]|nr:hypothetical protein DFH09DRAFT_1099251 [Mycena vulgaris]